MQIKLINKVPDKDGYFFMKFGSHGGLHLVLIQIQLDGNRVILPDAFTKQQVVFEIKNEHNNLLKDALFSEEPIEIV
jgi:hypothetical protein